VAKRKVPSCCPGRSLVSTPTELPQLHITDGRKLKVKGWNDILFHYADTWLHENPSICSKDASFGASTAVRFQVQVF
jgi:hypothetical protein